MNQTANGVQADWSIVEKGWKAHVLGEAPHKFPDAVTAIKELRVLPPPPPPRRLKPPPCNCLGSSPAGRMPAGPHCSFHVASARKAQPRESLYLHYSSAHLELFISCPANAVMLSS